MKYSIVRGVLYLDYTTKGGVNMNNLNKEHLFHKIENPFHIGFKFPVKVSKDLGNGLVNGYFDTNKMSTVKKILAETM